MNTTIPLSPAEQFSYQGIRVQSLSIPAGTSRMREVQFHGVRNHDGPAHMQIPATFSRDTREALRLLRANTAAASAYSRLSQALAPAAQTQTSALTPARSHTRGR